MTKLGFALMVSKPMRRVFYSTSYMFNKGVTHFIKYLYSWSDNQSELFDQSKNQRNKQHKYSTFAISNWSDVTHVFHYNSCTLNVKWISRHLDKDNSTQDVLTILSSDGFQNAQTVEFRQHAKDWELSSICCWSQIVCVFMCIARNMNEMIIPVRHHRNWYCISLSFHELTKIKKKNIYIKLRKNIEKYWFHWEVSFESNSKYESDRFESGAQVKKLSPLRKR